jgi:CelD/BcsL family acetyltransferase involved in cellulose biosynthesis
MSIHQDWSTTSFDLAPIAPFVGPFPGRDWLRTWWDHRCAAEPIIADSDNTLVVLTLTDGMLELAGEADLADYHSPLGDDPSEPIGEVVGYLDRGTSIRFDSLPTEAASAMAKALKANGLEPVTTQHEIAAVLDLPSSFDEYLHSLGKKERHELRRKRRRFEDQLGTATLERRSGADAVSLFADLHRRSSGDKGSFMTPEIEKFFDALHRDVGAAIDVLVDGSRRPASAVFSFEDEECFYLYNSAFEPELGNLSPGNVMLSHLIEREIERGTRRFDFLKGDETYKFRLGAQPRPLFCVQAEVGGSG